MVAVGKYQSVSRAASSLGLSQPAVTKCLRDMEDILRLPLVERTAKGVMPTPFGKLFISSAKSILAELRRSAQELSASLTGVSSQIFVGWQLAAEPLLRDTIAAIETELPNVGISLVDGSNDILLSSLREGVIDLVVGRLPEPRALKGLEVEALFEEQIWVVGRADHPLTKRSTALDIESLCKQQLILPLPHMTAAEEFKKIIYAEGCRLPDNCVETVSSSLVYQLLQDTDLIALLPKQSIIDYVQQGTLAQIPTTLQPISGSIGITMRADVSPTPIVETVRAQLRKAGQSIQ